VITLRKQNFSDYDIARLLNEEGKSLSIPSITAILQQEGFTRLPHRRDDERPARLQPESAPSADVRLLSLEPRQIRTKFGGVFLFLPYPARNLPQKIRPYLRQNMSNSLCLICFSKGGNYQSG
jgi:hypothetical protein